MATCTLSCAGIIVNKTTKGLTTCVGGCCDWLEDVELRYDGYHSVGEAAAQRAQELALAHVEALQETSMNQWESLEFKFRFPLQNVVRTHLWVSQSVSESLVPEDVVVVLAPAGRVHHVTARRRVRRLGQVRPVIEVVKDRIHSSLSII